MPRPASSTARLGCGELVLPTGGHMLVGNIEQLRAVLAGFLGSGWPHRRREAAGNAVAGEPGRRNHRAPC
ncbi:hypothetical protein [Frankia sp. AiPa1]|uniref:hypothetical protein n=1 Tax=Frankia sp. AiPa1 TaxID=573492 RepID=UPI00202B2A11|nr:hypothetical protein [Frankia sp. AiPa1]MCL9758538.1 hypothetical protein [Frankia sp. AiPa1]